MVMSGSGERILIVHDRPGDESALTGGTIARLRADGARVVVLYATALTETDAAAVQAALAALSARSWHELPRGLEPSSALHNEIDELGATALVVGAVDDVLRDAATVAAHAAGLPVFLARTVRQSPGQRLVAIDVGAQLEQKLRALTHFPARWNVTDHRRDLVDGTTDVITDTETFLQTNAPYPAPPQLASRPARLTLANRSLAGLGGLLVGILFGVLGTIAHQATLTLFGIALPIGLTIAFVAIAALLLGLRLVIGDRFVVGLAATGLLVTIFVLSLRGSGGSVLVPAGLPGTLWTVVPALIAAFVLAWPKLPPRLRAPHQGGGA
ncbi:hypothetical protein [Cryobacterium sp. M91]|uniref:hypothetical protein n=1 Tax=Cryobacterium sp. M91 TaxID=2048294 RepID=UPI000CE5675C|nr:hypothetical protein [Cryobacterium sp. M91]